MQSIALGAVVFSCFGKPFTCKRFYGQSNLHLVIVDYLNLFLKYTRWYHYCGEAGLDLAHLFLDR